MSWTIQKIDSDPNDNNAKGIARLQEALEKAARKGILMFCSAPDIGAASSQILSSYYPFGCSTVSGRIFRIGAAKADGSTYGWTGDSGSVDFILPGHNAELREGDKIDEEDDTPKTGSSVATALAVGLAALIIYCVRLGAIYIYHPRKGNDTNAVSKDSVAAIKRFDFMQEAFKKLSPGYREKDRRVDVETFFGALGKDIDIDNSFSDEEKWAKITQLARDLVPWHTQLRNLDQKPSVVVP